jgi:hypothetical protein
MMIRRSEDVEVETLKMQHFIRQRISQAPLRLQAHRQKRIRRVGDSVELKLILKVQKTRNIDALNTLHKNIVLYVASVNDMGSSDVAAVYRETTMALESVLPVSELGQFLDLAATDRKARLKSLCDLVAGVRLFHRHLGRPGSGISDLWIDSHDIVAYIEQSIVKLTLLCNHRVQSTLQLSESIFYHQILNINIRLQGISLSLLSSSLLMYYCRQSSKEQESCHEDQQQV